MKRPSNGKTVKAKRRRATTPKVASSVAAKRIASGEERPHVQRWASDLLRYAEANWENVFCLYEIVAEASIRVRNNPRSRAKTVLEKVRPQFESLYHDSFPDAPDPKPGPGPFPDPANWPQVGVLKQMGYTTGQDNPGEAARRNILRRCFEGPIPNVHEPEYMRQWGGDKTPVRLSKMAWSLASFANNKILNDNGHVDDASRCWMEDLEWLRKKFYEGHFGFPWPDPALVGRRGE